MKNKETIYQSVNYKNFNTNGYLYQLVQKRTLTNVPHKHDFFEIIFIIKGQVWQNIDNIIKPLHAGQFTILSPKNIHFFEKQSEQTEIFSLSILSEKFSKFLMAYDFKPNYGTIYTSKNPCFINELLQLPTKSIPQQKLSVHTIISDLFTEIIRNNPLPNFSIIPQNLQTAIEKIRQPEYIVGGVQKLSELAGYSRVHLCRLIKIHFGKTAMELLHDIRMKLAREYLEQTYFSIEIITEKIGLLSVSQFHSAFKKYYRCTPNTYRKQYANLSMIL